MSLTVIVSVYVNNSPVELPCHAIEVAKTRAAPVKSTGIVTSAFIASAKPAPRIPLNPSKTSTRFNALAVPTGTS